jgi:ABC-type branched-subunit amino acid transport system ATPase component
VTTALVPQTGPFGLEVKDLVIAFGGNIAVDGASFHISEGSITGLIGPNGAGKTTTFNALNGLLRPDRGSVTLFGRNVSHVGAAGRARMGLGRTFQKVEICNAMTVWQNVSLGLEARIVGWNPLRQFLSTPAQRKAIATATKDALEICGLSAAADQPAARLSTGQRRLVELARVIAGGFRLLLLDEPSSGLDDEETNAFGQVLRKIVAESGRGILLVEHDMSLVMDVCSYLYVLDFGRLIFEGTPAEVQASELVRSAYLGDEAVEVGL